MRFGTADGLLPVAGTSRSETVFLAPGAGSERWRIFVHTDGDFAEYRMGFAEWLYRCLSGEDAFGPGSEEPPTVPARLELFPARLGEPIETVYGPTPSGP
jgi:hypothetical protein